MVKVMLLYLEALNGAAESLLLTEVNWGKDKGMDE